MKILVKISLYLALLLVVLAGLDFFIKDNCFLNDYIRGSFTETLGIIITIIFLEYLLVQHRKKEQNEEAKLITQRTFRLLNIYIEEYNKAAYNLAYKYEDYKKVKIIERNFDFRNLQELFINSPSTIESFKKSKVEVYFEKLEKLKELVKTILLQTDLTQSKDLADLLEDYLREIETFYPKDAILDDALRNRKLVERLISDHKGIVQYIPSNLINRYIRLYKLIEYHIDFIMKLSYINNNCA